MKITLKAARINAGLKQKEVSEKLGITAKTLQNYEKGITAPDMITVRKLEELYNMKSDDIIFFRKGIALSDGIRKSS